MENQNFKTTDFYSAVFLLAKGYKLIKIDKTNPRRFCFVFQDQEKIKLQELLKDTDKRVDNWLERAEEALMFAQHAKLAFENGNLQRKREILNALGSNLLLKDRKLHIDLENCLLPMQRIHSALGSKKSGF